MSIKITYANAIYLPDLDYWLDPKQPVEKAFISHAHFDHFADHQCADTSPLTARLITERTQHTTQITPRPWRLPWFLSDTIQATLYPAGHVLGSAMILFNTQSQSLLYTGDFKLRPSLTAPIADPPQADLLIMETTYGLPHYIMPPIEKVMPEIIDFCEASWEDNDTPVLFAYSLGKTQELLAQLSSYLPHPTPIYLHSHAYAITQIYEKNGIAFPPYFEMPQNHKIPKNALVIAPLQTNSTPWLRKIPNPRTAIVTGWALDPNAIYRYRTDRAFPISDHADFNELLDLVRKVKPRRVYTVHGFALEFAQTLRQQGIEAWALGEENQLDFFERDKRKHRFNFKLPKAPKIHLQTPPSIDTFLSFAHTAQQVAELSSKKAKVRTLAAYLANIPTEILPLVTVYFSGRVYPATAPKKLNFSWALMKRAVLEVAASTERDFKEIYKVAGDSATTTEVLLQGKTKPEPWLILNVARWFDHISTTSGLLQKVQIAANAISNITPIEAKYLSKLITGDMRLGLKDGLLEEAIAQAFVQPLRLVRQAYLLCGDIGRVALAAKNNTLAEISLQVFNPIPFMLATPMPTTATIIHHMGRELWVEYKFDGIRCQIHKQGTRTELYSRELNPITDTFHEIAIEASSAEFDFIADGEIIAWSNGSPLPFTQLQRRLGRRDLDLFLGNETPVILILYDCLYWQGQSLLQHELAERKRYLRQLFHKPWRTIALCEEQIVHGEEALEALFKKAREEGHEGLMIKNPRSIYTVGQRGQCWIKYKQPFKTIDVVVVAVEYGHGKRRGMLSDYTFAVRDDLGRLQPIGKAYSGLTNQEIQELTEHFLATAVEKQGNKIIVKPTIVLEIAFNGIAPSKRHPAGLALRFPRIVTIRRDKTIDQIDTLHFCQQLCKSSVKSLSPQRIGIESAMDKPALPRG
jgi:DNA ligase-1